MEQLTKPTGAHYLLRGFSLMWKPGIRSYTLVPLLINLILFAILIWFGAHYFSHLVHWIDGYLPSWLQWLNGLIWFLFAAAVSVIVVFGFTFVACLIGSPFNSALAAKVETYLTGETAEGETLMETAKDIPRVVQREWKKLLYIVLWGIGFIVLFFIPIIQAVAGILWFLFNGWVMAIQYLDYPADNHKLSFPAFRQRLAKHRLKALGFGILVMILSFVPIVNFLIMPAAVSGSAAMWVEILSATE